jgi:hypothetical protein
VAVAFTNLRRKLTATVVQLDEARLQDRYQGLDITPIEEASTRVPVRLGGEVQETRVVPRAGSPSLEVTIADGTGRAYAVFTGKKKIAGMNLGRGIVVEGVGRTERGHLMLMNPAYTLLP